MAVAVAVTLGFGMGEGCVGEACGGWSVNVGTGIGPCVCDGKGESIGMGVEVGSDVPVERGGGEVGRGGSAVFVTRGGGEAVGGDGGGSGVPVECGGGGDGGGDGGGAGVLRGAGLARTVVGLGVPICQPGIASSCSVTPCPCACTSSPRPSASATAPMDAMASRTQLRSDDFRTLPRTIWTLREPFTGFLQHISVESPLSCNLSVPYETRGVSDPDVTDRLANRLDGVERLNRRSGRYTRLCAEMRDTCGCSFVMGVEHQYVF